MDSPLKGAAALHAARVREWPKALGADLAWEPADFENEADYTLNLSKEEASEVRAALQHFNSTVFNL